MANAKLNDAELADKAIETFRAYGYEGTSLNRLAEATGLEKASLYYRYPGGKDEIVLAAVKRVGQWFGENVLQPLAVTGSPEQRVRIVAKRLREFYGDGSKPCVLDTLSLRGGAPELQAALRVALKDWLSAFAAIAEKSGFAHDQAALRAEKAVIDIEGALVLSRVLEDNKVFLRALARLRKLLTEA
jgi:AcrR family transcriptional regulator